MCNTKYPCWKGMGCPSKKCRRQIEKINTINKAIEEADLLYIDGTLVKPFTFDGEILSYKDLSTFEDMVVHIDNVKGVGAYE